MSKKILLTLLIGMSISMSAQRKTCDKPKEEVLEDLNSITKCSIESSKKTKGKRSGQIKVRVSASKKHYLKRRAAKKVVQEQAVAENVNLSTSGVKSTSSRVVNSLALKNRLSKFEAKNAKTFSTVDVIPTFKKCKATKDDKRLDCFNKEMVNHINTTFQYPSEAVRDHIQGNVWVSFIIDSEGRVTNVKTLGPDGGEILVEEAKKVVSELPFFVPGKFKGKSVAVKYGFPIDFALDDN